MPLLPLLKEYLQFFYSQCGGIKVESRDMEKGIDRARPTIGFGFSKLEKRMKIKRREILKKRWKSRNQMG